MTAKKSKPKPRKNNNSKKSEKTRSKGPQLQLIEWVDNAGDMGWRGLKEIELIVPTAITVGFVVKENRSVVCLASSLANNGDTNRRNYIIKSCIKKRTNLRSS